MDKPCALAFSRKIELRTCNEIPEEERSKIKYKWNKSSWEECRLNIQPLVHMVGVKQLKSPNGRRKVSMCYNFQLQDGTTMQVCNEMFSPTPGSIYTL